MARHAQRGPHCRPWVSPGLGEPPAIFSPKTRAHLESPTPREHSPSAGGSCSPFRTVRLVGSPAQGPTLSLGETDKREKPSRGPGCAHPPRGCLVEVLSACTSSGVGAEKGDSSPLPMAACLHNPLPSLPGQRGCSLWAPSPLHPAVAAWDGERAWVSEGPPGRETQGR